MRLLEEKHSAEVIKTRELILKKAPKTKLGRKSRQRAGQRLDREYGGAWVVEGLQRKVDSCATGQTPKGLYVVDAVRTLGQIEAIRRAYAAEVHHIHLTATEEELHKRYELRNREDDEAVTYEESD